MKTIWACQSCGHTETHWKGVCAACGSWNSLAEEAVAIQEKSRYLTKSAASKLMQLKDIAIKEACRLSTGFAAFDSLLGGGIVTGSLNLIAGEPGVGKSTLLLQLASNLARKGSIVLYVTGEESLEQSSLRAKRLGIDAEGLFLLNETLFNTIQGEVDKLNPDVIIVDSVQIIYKAEIPSAPGSISQVREIAAEFMRIAKSRNITVFLVGHVTKSGEIAGPRVLEHLVDVVLDFEGEKFSGFRIMRSRKNRFGPTEEIALFQMHEKGLLPVENPSAIFLEERQRGVSGSVVAATLEGNRSILIEIQALVASSGFVSPARRCAGIDHNRLALLLAVLEKKVGYKLYTSDVFVSIAGGMKIFEPAADLGILLAVAASFSNRVIDPDLVAIGEVGLSGDIRSASRIELRLKEAINLGFKKAILPKKNLKRLSSKIKEKITLIGVDKVEEAINLLL